jgi:putative CRISPR-associated protein (TIGR02619 family)
MKNKDTVKIVATVGASLITNFNSKEVREAIHQKGFPVPNISEIYARLRSEKTVSQQELATVKRRIQSYFLWNMQKKNNGELKDKWHYDPERGDLNKHASAEIQSLLEILEKEELSGKKILVYLLTTETDISNLAASIIKEALEEHAQLNQLELVVEQLGVKGLQVTDSERFAQQGFQELFAEIDKISREEPADAPVLLNITGGYKGVVPILTIIGQLFDYPLFYVYEFSKGLSKGNILLKIPPLPIQFDWNLIDLWQPYLAQRKITPNPGSADGRMMEEQLVPANMFHLNTAGDYERTTLGTIFHTYIENNTPHGRSVLGYLMEYKFFECWQSEPMKGYEVRRSEYLEGIEIDLLFSKTENGEEKRIWGEVKSYNQVYHAFNKKGRKRNYGFRLEDHLKDISKNLLDSMDAFFLMVYRNDFHELEHGFFNSSLKKMKALLNQHGISEFRVFTVTLDLDKENTRDRDNPYTQNLMSKKLTRDQVLFGKDLSTAFPRYLIVEEFKAF